MNTQRNYRVAIIPENRWKPIENKKMKHIYHGGHTLMPNLSTRMTEPNQLPATPAFTMTLPWNVAFVMQLKQTPSVIGFPPRGSLNPGGGHPGHFATPKPVVSGSKNFR